jgi:hypothetical protein
MSTLTTLTRFLQRPVALRLGVASALTAAIALLVATSGNAAPGAPAGRVLGWRAPLGQGGVTSFADFQENGTPKTIGVMISADTLATLPKEPSDNHHCYDRDGDGVTAQAAECIHTHEIVIPLPDAVTQRGDVPFSWVLLNWNLNGHMPPGIYDVPHFDVHFYLASIEDTFAIDDGPCGPEYVACDDYAMAKMPVPANLMHPDFKDVDAVAPAMGNHSWIYGVYGGKVTFWEQMIALSYLESRPNMCAPIKTPPAVEVAGYYPSQRCIRYDADADAYVISLDQFSYREAVR